MIKNKSILLGIIIGVLAALAHVIVYFFGIEAFVSGKWTQIPIAILVVGGVLSTVFKKKRNNGLLIFSEGVIAFMTCFGVGLLIYSTVVLLLGTVIDPGITNYTVNLRINEYNKLFKDGKIDKITLDYQLSLLKASSPTELFIYGYFVALFIFLFLGVFCALITSLVLRKETQKVQVKSSEGI